MLKQIIWLNSTTKIKKKNQVTYDEVTTQLFYGFRWLRGSTSHHSKSAFWFGVFSPHSGSGGVSIGEGEVDL